MWERMGSREKVLIVSLLIAGLIYVFYSYILTPQLNSYTENQTKLAAMLQEITTTEAKVKTINQETEAAGQAQQKLAATQQNFMTDMVDGQALVRIALDAQANGVKINSFTPGTVTDQTHFLSLPFNFSITGNYLGVLGFLEKLESLPNASEVTNISISKNAGATPEPAAGPGASPTTQPVVIDDGYVSAQFILNIYTLKTPQEKLKLQNMAKFTIGRYNAFRMAQNPKKATAGSNPTPLSPVIMPPVNGGPQSSDNKINSTQPVTPNTGLPVKSGSANWPESQFNSQSGESKNMFDFPVRN